MPYDAKDGTSPESMTTEAKLEIKFYPLTKEDRAKIHTMFRLVRELDANEAALAEALRSQWEITAQAIIQCCPLSGERQVALMKLEESLEYALKAIVRNPKGE